MAILKYLKENREASVGEIAGAIRLSFRSTSKHLGVLGVADIVHKDQRALQVFYRLNNSQKQPTKFILTLL
ncbi:MAG: helix-turn-helix transcriptional regulator [Candidatus Liptonbacteria bacterium]|nr:helix-turn-helix transcriptional regulator [Candidatus Liptonbacteria bacterium]